RRDRMHCESFCSGPKASRPGLLNGVGLAASTINITRFVERWFIAMTSRPTDRYVWLRTPKCPVASEKVCFSSQSFPDGFRCRLWTCPQAVLGPRLALADGDLLALFAAPPLLAGLHVELALAQFLGDATPFQQLLEAAQGRSDVLAVVDTHL